LLDQQNLSTELLKWFHKERSQIAVPGRGASDPYAIWIAEVMLQQTQVTTVWPYYTRWMEHYPTVEILARADLDQILKNWEGLGYYSRARNLHKAARFILDNFDGKLPKSVNELEQIPGIGPYTAGAISSMAFGRAVPLIDGNVLRVMTRLECNGADIGLTKTKTLVSTKLKALIPDVEPGIFNQGLMDLGRVICLPRNPICNHCPISSMCEAYAMGDVEKYPVKSKKQPLPHYHVVIGLVLRDDKVLIQKRPPEGLLGGLWEFPGGKIETGETGEEALVREIKEETDLDVVPGANIGTIRHAYTHFKITLSAWFCEWTAGEARTNAATENKWITLDEIDGYAFPKANLKILKKLDL